MRPIFVLSFSARLWARSRKDMFRAAEGIDRDCFACASKISAEATVWRQAIRSEAASDLGKSVGCVLWDIRKFFDSVSVLYDWSERAGRPMGLVRASTAIYLGPRFVTVNRFTEPGLFAAGGLPAGSILADVYTNVYCVEAFDDFVTNWP